MNKHFIIRLMSIPILVCFFVCSIALPNYAYTKHCNLMPKLRTDKGITIKTHVNGQQQVPANVIQVAETAVALFNTMSKKYPDKRLSEAMPVLINIANYLIKSNMVDTVIIKFLKERFESSGFGEEARVFETIFKSELFKQKKEDMLARHRTKQKFDANGPAREIQDYVYSMNDELQKALFEAFPSYGHPYCHSASIIAGLLLKQKFGDSIVVERLSGNFKYAGQNAAWHTWLVVTDKNGKKYYLSFTDGQFVDPPLGIAMPAEMPVMANGKTIFDQTAVQEYIDWYYGDSGPRYPVFMELPQEDLAVALENEAGMILGKSANVELIDSHIPLATGRIDESRKAIILKHFPVLDFTGQSVRQNEFIRYCL